MPYIHHKNQNILVEYLVRCLVVGPREPPQLDFVLDPRDCATIAPGSLNKASPMTHFHKPDLTQTLKTLVPTRARTQGYIHRLRLPSRPKHKLVQNQGSRS